MQLANKFVNEKKKASYSPTHSLLSQHVVLLSSVGTMPRAGGPSLYYNDPADYWGFRMIHLLKGEKGDAEGDPVSPLSPVEMFLQVR